MCVYIFLYICMHVCVCVCVCVCTCLGDFICICLLVNILTCTSTRAHVNLPSAVSLLKLYVTFYEITTSLWSLRLTHLASWHFHISIQKQTQCVFFCDKKKKTLLSQCSFERYFLERLPWSLFEHVFDIHHQTLNICKIKRSQLKVSL